MSQARFACRRPAVVVLAALLAVAAVAASTFGQGDVRSPLPSPVKARLGMANVPALSPLWLLPEYAA